MGWLIAAAAGVVMWLAWTRRRRAPVAASGGGDPYAGEVAEFRRRVADWCRG